MRLIDVDAINDFYIDFPGYKEGPDEDDVKAWLDKQPTIEAEPVRHASWKYYHKKGIAVCTDCSFERNLDDNFGHAVSCPNCGAKMDGGEKE